jgi:hypothetical protein
LKSDPHFVELMRELLVEPELIEPRSLVGLLTRTPAWEAVLVSMALSPLAIPGQERNSVSSEAEVLVILASMSSEKIWIAGS